jgi:hypothetical protein
MHRARASVPPDAIRIEDEVWQEAFRETVRPRSRAGVGSHDADRAAVRPVRARARIAASTSTGTSSRLEPEAAAARGVLPPARRTDERPVPRADKRPVSRTDERQVSRTDKRPVSRTDERQVSRTDERPVARTDDALVARTDDPLARRTVTITGRGAERNLPWATDAARRRPARRPHERAGFKPDRVAMWAVFLGVLLVFVAAASAHA